MTFQEALARITDPERGDWYMHRGAGGPEVAVVEDIQPVYPCGSRVRSAEIQINGGADRRLGAEDLNANDWTTDWIPF